jgi:uncharacterized protein (DUF2267 family)
MSPDAASGVVSPQSARASSLDVLRDVLSRAAEDSVAAQLHISIRTLRRYATGAVKMNWVTHTRLQRMAAELEAKRAAEREAARVRARSTRKRERVSETYQPAAPPAVALT